MAPVGASGPVTINKVWQHGGGRNKAKGGKSVLHCCLRLSNQGLSVSKNESGLPFPLPRNLPSPGIELCLLHWQADSLPLSHWGRL